MSKGKIVARSMSKMNAASAFWSVTRTPAAARVELKDDEVARLRRDDAKSFETRSSALRVGP